MFMEPLDRFDKFTDRARKVLTLAQEEATRFNHNYIGTEHLLLGLVREGEGVAAKVLAEMGVELNRVRSAVEFIIGRGDRMLVGEIGLTPRAKKVIELAVDEARRLDHHYIGTEHVLLGLVREGEGVAAGVLESLGVSLEKVRAETVRVLAQLGPSASAVEDATESAEGTGNGSEQGAQPGRGSGQGHRFDKFTDRARKVLTLAQEESTRFNHNYIGTEHLLLGLVREGEGVAAKILSNLGIELNRVRSAVEFMIGRGDRMLVGEIGLTPRAKKVIELAVDEARQLGHHYIGTEHLLLGLIREGEGVAAKVLDSLGVNLEKVRAQTIQVLSQSGGTDGQTIQSLSQSSTTHEWRNVAAGTPTSGPQPLEYGTEQALQLLRQRRWEYCLAQVAYPDPGESGVVRWVQGGGDEGRFGRDTTPIHQALQALGAEGWELVAIDTAPRDSGSSGAAYVLKRPL